MNSDVLTSKNNNHLPVFWRAKKKVQVDRNVVMDWFNNCFERGVEKYLAQNNLAFKVLLLLHSVPVIVKQFC
jgi:hypothetical protein